MLKALLRFLIFILMLLVFLCIPAIINFWAKPLISPILVSFLNSQDINISNIKIDKVGYKFPFGVYINEFSFDAETKIIEKERNTSKISGDQFFLRIIPGSKILNGNLPFELGTYGLVISPVKPFRLDSEDISNNIQNTNYSQIVARKYNESFICNLSSLYTSINFLTGLQDCYKASHHMHPVELAEVFFDILISGEKRFISINKLLDNTININRNDILELNSLFREPLDEAQISFIENFPLSSMNMLLIKKYSEHATRKLENNNRYQGINVNTAYFYFLISKYLGNEATNSMIKFYKLETSPDKKEFLTSALLGKVSKDKGVSDAEFLTPEFFSEFNYKENSLNSSPHY